MMRAYMPSSRPLAVPGIGFLQTIPVGRNDSEAFSAVPTILGAPGWPQNSQHYAPGGRPERRADGSGKLIE